MRKVKNNKGESIIETLLSTLIIVIVIAGFAEVVSVLSKTNATIKANRTNYNYDNITSGDVTQIVSDGEITLDGISTKKYKGVNIYIEQIDNKTKLYYYEYPND